MPDEPLVPLGALPRRRGLTGDSGTSGSVSRSPGVPAVPGTWWRVGHRILPNSVYPLGFGLLRGGSADRPPTGTEPEKSCR
ncbi:hypothetical protein IL38_15585 [Actinopolyspora erythraea]|uniref:Uncharacterized protein n=1 Tax=Actinopolyspora erythraea TaxID=414996 RepID=A0ABR4X2B1_9ACTN|nr:hypothetical protein IL38_15585 [Actinopolyspora erythraea]